MGVNEWLPDDEPPGLTPLSVPVPPQLAETCGYAGDARYVGFSWLPGGDEVLYDDGRQSGTGQSWAFLAYRRHATVVPFLDQYNLGYSDAEPDYYLIVDRAEQRASVAAIQAARAFLKSQHPPPPDLTAEQLAAVQRTIEETLHAHLAQPSRIDPQAIMRRMQEERQAIARMIAYLDEWPGN